MSVGELLEREIGRPAYVRFEVRAVQDAERSLEAGHYVSKDEIWALVTPPYSKDCVEKRADVWLAQKEIDAKNGRIDPNHLDFWKESYRRFQAGQDEPLNGTSLKDWNAISPAQFKNLQSANLRTVEDVAQANDEGLKRIGMGAIDLRNKARAWLQAAKDHGPLVNKVTSLEKENEILKGSVDSLTEQVTLLKRHLDKNQDDIGHSLHITQDDPRETISAADILGTPEERYEAKFGKKPHHLMKPETILKKLEE